MQKCRSFEECSILKFFRYRNYIGFISNGSTGTHVTLLNKDSKPFCSCGYFFFRKSKCRHLKFLEDNMSLLNLDDITQDKAILKIPSSLENINTLFEDKAYNSDQIFTVYGKSGVGKSYFLLQEAYYFTTLGYNVLYIDTEGGAIGMMKKKLPYFEKRFGKRNGDIFWKIDAKQAKDLAKYFGYDITFKLKKKKGDKKASGKIELSVNSIDELPEIENDIVKYKINIVIIDSISSPTKIFSTSKSQNLPARDDYTSLLYTTLISLQSKYNVIVMISAHASFNPTDPYHQIAEVRGGGTVHYFGKRIVYIDKRQSSKYSDYRRFWLKRGEAKSFNKATVLKIDEDGYHDVIDINEMKELFTQKELAGDLDIHEEE